MGYFQSLFPDAALFSASYGEARLRFLEALENRSLPSQYVEYVHPLKGPGNELLACDVAWLGAADAKRVLVLGSGCHGVEGFAGSAIQLTLLQNLAKDSLPAGIAILLIHAINPWGFAWLRRTDEQGIDVNRNFVDFKKPLPVNQGYTQLAEAIVPRSLTASVLNRCRAQTEAYRLHHGQRELEEAISAGQYSHPAGLFYGGTAPSWSRQMLENLYEHFALAKADRIIVVDLHSGLGPFGYGEIISDHMPGSHGAKMARAVFADALAEPLLGTSSSVPKLGLMDYFWHRNLGRRGCFVTLEFGTYSFESLWSGLQADHWLHQYGRETTSVDHYQQIKQQLVNHFNPADPAWREMVLFRGLQVIRQAIRGLQNVRV